MPMVNGVIYPELRPILHQFNILKVLILGDASNPDLAELLGQIDILHTYLSDIGRSNLKVSVQFNSPLSEENLLAKIGSDDLDVILDLDGSYSDKFTNKNFYKVEIVQTIEELVYSIENFLVGSGVAWRLREPVWNMQPLLRYMEQPGLCQDYYNYMVECQRSSKYTSEQIDRIRYIVNKIKQIDYARDLLQYYVKRLRKAERSGICDDDTYNLELNYHISNYYFLLAGTLDSMARLLNDFLKLKIPRDKYSDLGLEKATFIKRNKEKRTGLARKLSVKKINHWMSFLKKRRNFIAHEGDMRQTPLVEEIKTPLTDIEINAIVDKQMDWTQLARLVPQEMYDAHRAMAFEMARIKNNYKVIARNIMHIPGKNGGTIWLPLMSVDFDYEHLSEIMSKILMKLKSTI